MAEWNSMSNSNGWYHSYLLRLWNVGRAGEWHASLEDPSTGERRGFTGVEVLFTFLRAQVQLESSKKPYEEVLPEDKRD